MNFIFSVYRIFLSFTSDMEKNKKSDMEKNKKSDMEKNKRIVK